MTSIEKLLEDSRKLSNYILSSSNSINPIERGIEQIDSLTKKLSSVHAPINDSTDSKAAFLLAQKGFDISQMHVSNKTDSFSIPVNPAIKDSDLLANLASDHSTIISLAIENSRSSTSTSSRARFQQRLVQDWEQSKKRIFDELGMYSKYKRGLPNVATPVRGTRDTVSKLSPFSPGPGGLVTMGSTAPPSESSIQLFAKNKAYANILADYNSSRLNSQPFDLIQSFGDACKKLDRGESNQQQLGRCWTLIKLILKDAPYEGTLAKSYQCLDEDVPVQAALNLRHHFVKTGKQFLESLYWDFLQNQVISNRVQIGGTPSVDVFVSAFVALKYAKFGQWPVQTKLEFFSGVPIWAIIFYMMRCGKFNEAVAFIQKRSEFFSETFDENFPMYFETFVRCGSLNPALRKEVINIWNAKIAGNQSIDPFKVYLYKFIGRCEMSVKTVSGSDLSQSVEDYIWIHLMFVNEHQVNDNSTVKNTSDFDEFSLRDISKIILKFGANHFSASGRTPIVYFMILLLCGEFERAVAHLYSSSISSLQTEAVHFAISLASKGCLRCIETSSQSSDLLYSKKMPAGYEVAYLQYSQMISSYIRPFLRSDPIISLHYGISMALVGCKIEGNIDFNNITGTHSSLKESLHLKFCRDATKKSWDFIKELLLESEIPASLLGVSLVHLGRGSSQMGSGELARFISLFYLTKATLSSEVIIPAALESESRGLIDIAIRLYDFAGNYESVISLLCRQISDFLMMPLQNKSIFKSDNSQSPKFYSQAKEYLESLRSKVIEANGACVKTETLRELLKVYDFHDAFKKEKNSLALEKLKSISMFPLKAPADMNIINSYAVSFQNIDDQLAICAPHTLLYGMQLVKRLYSTEGNEGKAECKAISRVIMLFCASIQYRIPGEIFSQMAKLEGSLL